VLRVHQHGLSKSNPFISRRLRFDQLDSFTFRKTRLEVGGTKFFFEFGHGSRSIFFQLVLPTDTDQQVEDLCAHVTKVTAERISRQLDETGQAPWTVRLRFVRDGLEYFYQRSWHFVSLGMVANCTIHDDIFYLRSFDSDIPFFRESIGVPNFYPGLRILVDRSPRKILRE
jgi:hypothetical protein